MKYLHARGITALVSVLVLACGVGAKNWWRSQQPSAIQSSDVQLQHNTWRGLIPLQSKRADVERLLNSPRLSHGFTYVYQTGNERVDVLYSAGPCQMSGVERWKVPADTVLKIMVTPKATLLIRDLRPDATRYSRTQDAHPENWVHYWNLEDGITVDALLNDGCEEVLSVTYQASAKDRKSPLACG